MVASSQLDMRGTESGQDDTTSESEPIEAVANKQRTRTRSEISNCKLARIG
jgi:hypothetical protein